MWLQNCKLYGMHNILHLFHAATFKDLMKSPGALSVIGSSQGTPLYYYQKGMMLQSYYIPCWRLQVTILHVQFHARPSCNNVDRLYHSNAVFLAPFVGS